MKEKDKDSIEKIPKYGPSMKVMCYLLIIPRIKRLFANPNDAKNIKWHADERKCEGMYCHLVDSIQWNKFDDKFLDFSNESRNIQLGLTTNEMNLFGNLNTNHNSWPVLLIIYNLPLGLCMKQKYIMMISGPRKSGNDIDVYLSLLIENLKLLWDQGVEVFDKFANDNFKMHAMLFCAINDFPTYEN